MKEAGSESIEVRRVDSIEVLFVGKVFLFGYYLRRRGREEEGGQSDKESVRWKMCALFRVSAVSVLGQEPETLFRGWCSGNTIRRHEFCERVQDN